MPLLPEILRAIRGDLSQSEMAALLTVTQPTVWRWEAGERAPSPAMLDRMRGLAMTRDPDNTARLRERLAELGYAHPRLDRALQDALWDAVTEGGAEDA